MKRGIVAFAVAVAALAPFFAGCAADEAEAGEAAYPTAVGYTPPPSEPPPPPSQPPPQGDPGAAMGSDPAAAPPSDVVVGDGDGDGDAAGSPDDGTAAPSDGYADTDPAALSDFRSTLDPYGAWSDDPNYGTVWVPSQAVVGDDFSPYVSGGHWAYDDDYTWVSDYDWGWAPFHYGRWVYGGRGWSWIPGRSYAGAWVSWRYGAGGYVGWAPMAPSWGWRGGRSVALGFAPRMPYAFVGTSSLFAPSLGGRVIVGPQAAMIGAHTQPWVVASPTVGVGGRLGPPLSALNIAASAVVRPSANAGLAQARAFARPSTARALGASAPAGFRPREVRGAWSPRGVGSTRPVTAYPSVYSSHFGGRLGAGFRGSAASAAPMRSVESARPYYGTRAGPSYGPSSSYRPAPGGGVYGGYRGPVGGGYRAPVGSGYSGPVSGGYARPSGAPSGASGGYHAGGSVGGGFSGGGGFHSGGGGGGGSRGGGRGGRR